MNIVKTGVILLLAGILLASFSELIIDQLNIERAFGQVPASIKLLRLGLLIAALGFASMLYGSWKNKRRRG
jgi:hypothetical protein